MLSAAMAIVWGVWIDTSTLIRDKQIHFPGKYISYSFYTTSYVNGNRVRITCWDREDLSTMYVWISEDTQAGSAIPDNVASHGDCKLTASSPLWTELQICGCMEYGECRCNGPTEPSWEKEISE